jgi:hypothetical protein
VWARRWRLLARTWLRGSLWRGGLCGPCRWLLRRLLLGWQRCGCGLLHSRRCHAAYRNSCSLLRQLLNHLLPKIGQHRLNWLCDLLTEDIAQACCRALDLSGSRCLHCRLRGLRRLLDGVSWELYAWRQIGYSVRQLLGLSRSLRRL